MVTVFCVRPDKSGQVRRGVKCFFSSTVSPTLFKFGPPPKSACSFLTSLKTLRPSAVVETALCHASAAIRCELVWSATFLRRTTTSETLLESPHSWTLKYAVSTGLAKRQKNYRSFNFLPENLEKFRSTEHCGAPLEGLTIFLCRSSLGSTVMESCRLPELKYAIFSRAGRKTKKLPRSKLFLSTAFKHGLLEGSTFLFYPWPVHQWKALH